MLCLKSMRAWYFVHGHWLDMQLSLSLALKESQRVAMTSKPADICNKPINVLKLQNSDYTKKYYKKWLHTKYK